MEELQDKVSQVLLTLNAPDLISVCQRLKCSEPTGGFESKSRRALNRLVEKTLDDIEEDEDNKLFLQYLEDLLSFVNSLNQPNPGVTKTVQNEPNELDILKEKYSKLQQEQSEARQSLEGEIAAVEQRLRASVLGQETRATTMSPPMLPEVTLRKEFQICGQIGEAGQREKLLHQPYEPN
ncbi:uncharacterized protein LOC127456496 isoform X2 [Myxocyprinus asiaticus]|uniref:uncharacterized protein LOC127456496 isoform X2 n=1 Tax=Myxocyprinus asiaticus TaxID=70543 RepID=UPI002221D404|nr:uncharacterized protein LOC127456496 isoform X2 [Myxocyprinus asiaticus]